MLTFPYRFYLIFPLVLFPITLMANPDPFLGLWRSYKDGKIHMEVSIEQFGFKSINYNVTMILDGQQKFNANFLKRNDTLIHYTEWKDVLKIFVSNQGLVFLTNENILQKEISKELKENIPPKKNNSDFFYVNVTGYPPGYPEPMDSYNHFPFQINNEFIKSRKIDQLKILINDSLYNKRSPENSIGYLMCHFSSEGFMDSMIFYRRLNTVYKYTDIFHYYRNNVNPEKLDSVKLVGRFETEFQRGQTIHFDKDNWPVDKYGQKENQPHGSFSLDEQGKPTELSLSGECGTIIKYTFHMNQLIKLEFISKCDFKYFILFHYNELGILDSIHSKERLK